MGDCVGGARVGELPTDARARARASVMSAGGGEGGLVVCWRCACLRPRAMRTHLGGPQLREAALQTGYHFFQILNLAQALRRERGCLLDEKQGGAWAGGAEIGEDHRTRALVGPIVWMTIQLPPDRSNRSLTLPPAAAALRATSRCGSALACAASAAAFWSCARLRHGRLGGC